MFLRWGIVFFLDCGFYWGRSCGWSCNRSDGLWGNVDYVGGGKVCRLGWRWAVRGGPVVRALHPVFVYSNGSTAGCW